MTLQRALIALIAVALLAGLVPAGLALDHWLRRELEGRVREELAQAPRLLADRSSTISSAMMMYAKDVASAPGLAEAVSRRDRTRTLELLEEASAALKAQPVLQLEDGELWAGPPPSSPLVEATRRGEMPVRVVCDGETLRMFALAPLEQGGDWLGAAGVVAPWDETMAGTLAGLTRSDLVLLGTKGAFVATEAVAPAAAEMIRRVEGWPADGEVRELQLGARRYLVAIASVDDATILFLRDMQRELAVLPKLRLITVSSGVVALALALVLGSLLAVGLARPVRALAAAADRLATGDFDAPLAASPIQEVERVTQAFDAMRRALAARLEELQAANRELGERQSRLTALQSELLQRERIAVSGRLVAELAHEIRNPVANLRNCLELLHRRLGGDAEGQEFASLAIDELLRMHELAERMLDLNRPRDPGITHCDVAAVAREVAALVQTGNSAEQMEIALYNGGETEAAIPPDALKQVLLNLVHNAREARPLGLRLGIRIHGEGPRVVLDVEDNGPGIPPEILRRIFDPFFTTKSTGGAIGLGLYVAEGIVRGNGGTISVSSDPAPGGTRFRIELPRVQAAAAPPVVHAPTVTDAAEVAS